ncbi:MAG: DNA polymerase III subunit alpha [Parcubacteria group bacterium Gr01-1014_56]|nr:MAG: DNA polymerase III subunit alpha [Parcubacteria group bacterium Gr01-1014_56]
MKAAYAHLHVHSHYSLLRAVPKIPDLVAKAKEAGCEALALTDIDNLYGAIEFYKECKNAGIKPIIGLSAHIGGGSRLLLYAKDHVGYQNLLALVTKSHLEFPDKPTVTEAMRKEHEEGLLVLDPNSEDIALPEIFYINPSDRRAWETMRAIENKAANEGGDMSGEEHDYHFPTPQEMEKRFTKVALAKTLEVALECNLELALGTWVFPDFGIPEGSTYDQELRTLIEEGIQRRFLSAKPEVRDRIEYEYKIITEKGYSPYFLVVADLLAFARKNRILTTIRGSVAGSMITFVTGITNVNPIDYKLPFERFLNPERPSAPDIDMDFADNRRDEVIEYVRKKYGDSHVAQIGTFGTMLARGVVRDVARALGYPYGLGDRIAKEIPFGSQGFPMTLKRALEENPELKKIYETESEAREIIDLGKTLEGCARHISVHAAGVVIAPRPLFEYSPIQRDPKGGKLITQYDMYSIEEAGLLKFDFLGIRNLAILAHSVELVEATRGITIDIENVPVDDKKTFEMLARGETEGTFQLNGAGMTRYLKELKPSSIHDINAMVALFRPGPMETIPQYIESKHNPKLIKYLDPRMKEYLDFSYGVLVYQDDVLLTAIKLGGYSWLEADKLRKAMGKKIPEVMAAEKEKLTRGFVEYGKLSKQLAEKLWKLIEPFAAYGFNKAHAASYGKVAYQTAYMKANFPVEYMAAILTAEAGDIDTVGVMVAECKRIGIPVLPPDVNESFGDFTVILGTNSSRSEKAAALAGDIAEDAIRFGLYSIKNFGSGVADAIIAERKAGGKFVSLSDFLNRVKEQGLNKKGLESLIQCGALDSLGERGQMLASIELLLEYHREASREQSHDSLFMDLGTSVSDLVLSPAAPASLEARLAWEKELLGLYVSGHPLDRFRDKLARSPTTISELKLKTPGIVAVAAGMVESVRLILTRGGDQMAFVKLADFGGSIEAAVFPRIFQEYKSILKPETVIALKGRLSSRNGELSMVADKLKAL